MALRDIAERLRFEAAVVLRIEARARANPSSSSCSPLSFAFFLIILCINLHDIRIKTDFNGFGLLV